MVRVECVHRKRLLAAYEAAVRSYADLLNQSGYSLDFTETRRLRGSLDRMEDEITAHCVAHGCDSDWVKSRGVR